MPMNRELYPEDWEAIALTIKEEVNADALACRFWILGLDASRLRNSFWEIWFRDWRWFEQSRAEGSQPERSHPHTGYWSDSPGETLRDSLYPEVGD